MITRTVYKKKNEYARNLVHIAFELRVAPLELAERELQLLVQARDVVGALALVQLAHLERREPVREVGHCHRHAGARARAGARERDGRVDESGGALDAQRALLLPLRDRVLEEVALGFGGLELAFQRLALEHVLLQLQLRSVA